MHRSQVFCSALAAGLIAIAATGAHAQTPAARGGTEQPSMTPPTAATPAPVVRDRPGGDVLAVKPPPNPAPVRTDPAGSTLPPLPCRDGPFRATIGGRTRTITGHFCEQPDGTWAPTR